MPTILDEEEFGLEDSSTIELGCGTRAVWYAIGMATDPSSQESSNDPLRELVDVEFAVGHASGPSEQAALAELLGQLPGIENTSLLTGHVALTYDPELVTREQILERVRGGGFEVHDVHGATASPISDALEKLVIEGRRKGDGNTQEPKRE